MCSIGHTSTPPSSQPQESSRCILGAIAEFERARIGERVKAGLQRAGAQGKRLGRPHKTLATMVVPGGTVRAAARVWGVSKTTAARWIAAGRLPHSLIDRASA
jgi:DNA invertase Pin-like site-specific DNA recombinase